MDELNSILRIFERRLWLRDGWLLAQKGLWISAVFSFLIHAARWIWPIRDPFLWGLAPVLLWLTGIAFYMLFMHTSPLRTAQRVDLELNLKERLSTALIFGEKPDILPSPLVARQQIDALEAAKSIRARNAFPLPFLPTHLCAAGVIFSLTLISASSPGPNKLLADRLQIEQAAQEQAQQIDRLAGQFKESKTLSEEDRTELMRRLDELAKALRTNPGSLEEALAALSKMEQELSKGLDPSAPAQAANLPTLASALQKLAGQESTSQQDPVEAASEALSQLAEQISKMDENERREMAEALAQLAAQTSQSGDQNLAQSLSALSQALQSGDPQAVQQAAQTAQQALAQAQQRLAGQAARLQSLSQLQASRNAMTQAAQALAQNPGTSPGQSPGQNPGQSTGQNPGSGQPGTGPGGQPGGPGGGSTNPSLPPFTGQGAPPRPTGNKPGETGADLPAQVYAPWVGSSLGNELFIPGQETGQGDTEVTPGQGQLPGAINPSLVPYYQVFYTYSNAANQALQNGYIPTALMLYVQQYFLALQPSTTP